MTFAGNIFLMIVIGLIIAIWQWAVWSRRSSRREEVLVERRDPRGY